MRTTGEMLLKRYRCKNVDCQHVRLVSTNHYGDIFDRCPKCSWKHPRDVTISECLEPLPTGWIKPDEWTTIRLGEVLDFGNLIPEQIPDTLPDIKTDIVFEEWHGDSPSEKG